jgi:hypothetical protein
MMTGLTVLYDSTCPVCRRARRFAEWVRRLTAREIDPGDPLPPPDPARRCG